MKKTTAEHDRIEHLMKQVRPTGTSPQLKDRVTSAAMKAWGQTPPGVPWQIPLRRLAVSAAAAVLVVSLADAFSHQVAARWHPGESRVTSGAPAELEDLSEFVRHVAVGSHRPPGTDGLSLYNYIEQVRDMLEEAQPNGNTIQSTPTPGRSRLAPAVPLTKSWS